MKKSKHKPTRRKKMKHASHKTRREPSTMLNTPFWKQRHTVTGFIVGIVFGVIGVVFLAPSPALITDDILFPADAGIVNVKNAPYNANGDGVCDDNDSDALLQAFLDNDYVESAPTANPHVDRAAARTVYLPAGTYCITKELMIEGSGVRITGAGRGKTILKLKDNTFTNAASPKYVLAMGTANYLIGPNLANGAFSNYVEHLTIDIGSGNPGANGVRYHVANQGAMRHVDIKSSDPNKIGKYGIGFITSAGPGFVQDVTVTGFDYGVYLDSFTNNVLTFEDLTLDSQKIAGIHNVAKNIVLENLTSLNNPVTIETEQAAAAVMIIGGTLDGTGSGTAINLPVKGYLYARDITTTGYSNMVSVAGSNSFVGKSSLTEWSTENYRIGTTAYAWTESNSYVGLHLPIEKTPDYYSSDFSTWANVQSHGATAGVNAADSANSNDDGPAIQAAIDSGKETIYFPYGFYTVRSPVHIRGNIKRIDFMHSRVDGVSGGGVVSNFIVDGVNGDTVIMENAVTNMRMEQNSSDSMVVRNLNGGKFDTGTNATGDLFVENTGAHTDFNITEPINVWARSMDRTNAEWLNDGGTLWVLSNNIESDFSPIETINGGKTEIIGGTADNLGQYHDVTKGALFTSTDSYMSFFTPGSLRDNGGQGIATWDYFVHDDSSAGIFDLYNADKTLLVDNGTYQKFVFPMYVTPGYTYPSTGDTTDPTVSITSPSAGSTQSGTIAINASASDNVGVTQVEFLVDGVVRGTDSSAPYSYNWDTTSVSNGSHSLTTRAYDAASNTTTSSAVSVTVNNAAPSDTTPPTTSITAPAAGAVVAGTINITANASDNIGVARVELFIDGSLVATDFAAPYIYSWNTTSYSNGSHTLSVKAYDAANNSTTSTTVTVTVTNPVPPTPEPGDVDGDGDVDVFDLSILANNFSLSGRTRSQGDLNGDGVVNVFDLSILAINWGN